MTGLLLARFLFSPNQNSNKDTSSKNTTLGNVDYGAKLIIDGLKHFTISGELLGRKYFNNNNQISSEISYALGISYEIFKNQTLTFSIGKDFNTNPQLGGNLIAAIKFSTWFWFNTQFTIILNCSKRT